MVNLLTACCLAHRVPQGIPTHRVVVPTVGTLRTRYVAGALMNAGAHVLLIGPAGAVWLPACPRLRLSTLWLEFNI